ncbi:MAG: EFR1 family ferrodoxin [Spirochaetales bacterium]|nr:EFR1 family ferrodoxin [Spirochaetales bacterium]
MKLNEVNLLVFSPTGSGLNIAKQLTENITEIKTVLLNVTYPRIRAKIKMTAESDSLTIIIFPIYADSLPDIFSHFISKYNFNFTPVILVAGYGNIYTGKALNDIQKIISRNNGIVISASNIVFPHSYNNEKIQIEPHRPTPDEIKHINQFIHNSIQKALNSENLKLSGIDLPDGNKRLLSRFPQKFLPHIFIKKPDVDLVNCNKCKICINACPTGAIEDDLKINNSLCIRCLACIKYCKSKARTLVTRTNLLITTLNKESRMYHKNEFYI